MLLVCLGHNLIFDSLRGGVYHNALNYVRHKLVVKRSTGVSRKPGSCLKPRLERTFLLREASIGSRAPRTGWALHIFGCPS